MKTPVLRTRIGIAAAAVILGATAIPAVTLSASASTLTPPTQNVAPQTSVGKGEGQLNLIAWEGYAQP